MNLCTSGSLLGAVQRRKNSKNPRILWKWVGGSMSRSEFLFCLNHPKIALNQYRYFGVVYHTYILSVYTLLKVVSYYDLSVLSMSVMVSKKSLDGGGGGWVGWALSKFFWDFFNFAKPLRGWHTYIKFDVQHVVHGSQNRLDLVRIRLTFGKKMLQSKSISYYFLYLLCNFWMLILTH